MVADVADGQSGAWAARMQEAGRGGGVASGQYVDTGGEDVAGFHRFVTENEVDVDSACSHDAEQGERAGGGIGDFGTVEYVGAAA
ncbi:hypothetical protein [Nonomuraea sp. B19D2]|uniref:hypothetical protein n=1 Tax=Nonomuraea sp. B19D2 TaxID=3159561 RepID=UPI0032DA707F